VAHPASSNLFEELETTRGTSWQYELHQLRLLNRRLKEDVGAARAVAVKNEQAGKVRRGAGQGQGQGQGMGMGQGQVQGNAQGQGQGQMGQGNAYGGQSGQGGNGAAPRHQLAPGFGLVTQGMPGAFF
jgi:hypothetical protein